MHHHHISSSMCCHKTSLSVAFIHVQYTFFYSRYLVFIYLHILHIKKKKKFKKEKRSRKTICKNRREKLKLHSSVPFALLLYPGFFCAELFLVCNFFSSISFFVCSVCFFIYFPDNKNNAFSRVVALLSYWR